MLASHTKKLIVLISKTIGSLPFGGVAAPGPSGVQFSTPGRREGEGHHWHPSHTALQSATTLHYITHLCLNLRWHPFPYCSLPPPPAYNNGVAPLTYCTAVCHRPALHHTPVYNNGVAPLTYCGILHCTLTRTSRTGEVTRMVSCRFVHRCCR